MSQFSRSLKTNKRRRREIREKIWLDKALRNRGGLAWRRSAPCDIGLYDAGSAQIGNLLYIFGGYVSLDRVSDEVRIFNLETEKWLPPLSAPRTLPQSHTGVVSDGKRFIYVVSGQLGPQCSPAVRDVHCLDTLTGTWLSLPPLPAARYAGTAQLWRGRLHFVGGAKEDRWTPAADHWSLGVLDGQATGARWTELTEIPLPAMHRGSIVFNESLYVFGGQQGDFVAIEGDPDCKCTGHTQETYTGACFRLDDPGGQWTKLADMPIPASHTDFSVTEHEGRLLVTGGQIYKHPQEFWLRLTDAVQSFDPETDQWTIAGHLPYRLKLPCTGVYDGKYFTIGGQSGVRGGDTPGPVVKDVWAAPLAGLQAPGDKVSPSPLRNKSIVLLTHNLSYSGAPLLLLETAKKLIARGASVRLASIAGDTDGWTVASDMCIPVIPVEMVAEHAASADLVVANTASKEVMQWVDQAIRQNPEIAENLVSWVHEIDVGFFLPEAQNLRKAAMTIFDSHACRDAWISELGELPDSVVIHPFLNPAVANSFDEEALLFPKKPASRVAGVNATREEVRRHLGLKEDDFLVLSLATVEKRKGQRLLLDTLTQLAREEGLPVKLLLVGFRNWRQRLKFLLKMRPGNWRVLSAKRAYVWQTEIAAFYSAADAFVTNTQGLSTDCGECFGRATVEAMSSGVVALGTSAGGTREIIEDGKTGLLFPAGAEGQSVLALHLKRLISNPGIARELAASGRVHCIAEFSQTRFMREFEQALATRFKW